MCLYRPRIAIQLYTFDCTLSPSSPPPPPYVHLYNWCLGKEDIPEKSFYSFPTILKKLGHTHVDLLKMDIEGWEWDVMFALLDDSNKEVALPAQISWEIHVPDAMNPFLPTLRMIDLLNRRGYRLFSKELNPRCLWCTELSHLRVNS